MSEQNPTPTLDAAHRAFDRGDFREANRLARALVQDAADDAARAAAETLRARLRLDPAIVYVTLACVALFVGVVVATLR